MDMGREQDQSIKDRKRLLYEDDAPLASSVKPQSKPFALYLRETPAAPLALWVRAALWAAGLVVAMLLVGAVMKSMRAKETPKRKAERASTSSSVKVRNESR